MILNFLFFYCFLIVLSSLGNLFNFHYLELKKTSEPKNFLTVENIISGIFLLGLITVLVNFFLPLDNLVLKFFLTTLFLYSLFFSKKNIFFSIKKNFIFILFISLISFYMQPGYDGGLYHLPHQNFIRDYKIIFGLFNLHERFGLASIYGYISSLFWIKMIY